MALCTTASSIFRNITKMSANEGHVEDDCSDSAANATDGKYCIRSSFSLYSTSMIKKGPAAVMWPAGPLKNQPNKQTKTLFKINIS